jgi:hypothetical protein
MKLPNGDQAIVEIAKLRDYSLNATHEEGKHKARVFAAALGIGADDANWLRDKLLEAALTGECSPGKKTVFGQRYVLNFTVTKDRTEARIRSVWNVRPGETAPRLTTCYVL